MNVGPVVLAAGGTGGHLFPAEALAYELLSRGRSVALVTDKRGRAFPITSVPTYFVAAGRSGGGWLERLKSAAGIAYGTISAIRLLKRLSPRAVVGFGGYPSFPTMVAAARLKLPTVIHEQNAVLGRANRMLAPRVRRIAGSFEQVAGLNGAAEARLVPTGNPVRPAVVAIRDQAFYPPTHDGEIRLLITGGSQGARILSRTVPAALTQLPETLRQRLVISHQARPEDVDAVAAAYRGSIERVEVRRFFDDLPARLAAAHLVICRAGASTVAELAVAGRPAILVPYAAAIADEQTANGNALVDQGAAWMLQEADFTPDALSGLVATLLESPEQLAEAAAAARALGRPEAARALADLVERVEMEGTS